MSNKVVEVHRNESSQPMVYSSVVNCYTKGKLLCVMFKDIKGLLVVHKYPINSLFRVVEYEQPTT